MSRSKRKRAGIITSYPLPTLLWEVLGSLGTVEGTVVMNGTCPRVTCPWSRTSLAVTLAQQCEGESLVQVALLRG